MSAHHDRPPQPAWVAQASLLPAAEAAARQGRFAEAERLLRRHLQTYPSDEDARFWLARVLAWQKRFAEALALYDLLLEVAPDNGDYWLGKGQTHYWRGDHAEALTCAAEARALAMSNAETWRLQLKALAALGPSRNEEARALRAEAHKRFPHAAFPLPLDAPPPSAPLELEAGTSFDYLTNGYAPWLAGHVFGRYLFAPRTTAYARFQETQRFGLWDSELQAGGTLPVGGPVTALLEASFSPTANVLAQWAVVGMAEWPVRPGVVTWMRLRHAAYALTDLDVGTFGVEGYLDRFRFTLAGSASRSNAPGLPLSVQGAMSYMPTERDAVTLRLGTGEENEIVGPSKVIKASILSVGLEGRWWLTPEWALTSEVGWARQGAFYDRAHLLLGVKRAL